MRSRTKLWTRRLWPTSSYKKENRRENDWLHFPKVSGSFTVEPRRCADNPRVPGTFGQSRIRRGTNSLVGREDECVETSAVSARKENQMTALGYMFIFLSILVLAMRYIVGAIMRWVHPERVNVKKDYSFTPPVSVLLPNYNEGPAVYETIRSIMSSEYAGFLEVIAIDDGSVDDSVLWLEKAAQGFPNVQVHKNEKNMGKNKTVLRALGFSQGEIILCIDSDTVFAKNTIAELAACYSEPTLGAVGGVVRVLNADKNVITRFQATQYYLSFELGKSSENWSRTVGCLSGCLLSIRREILVKLEPALEARHWFGIPTSEGEDRHLSHRVVLEGWGSYINLQARCWTAVPETLPQYFKQQLRWRRSAIRDLFWTIRTIWDHTGLHWNTIYVFLLLPMTSLLAILRIMVGFVESPLWWMSPTIFLLYMVVSAVVALALNHYSP